MKKIGIITICDNRNYGNRLQNYASQEFLKSLGLKPETIVNRSPPAGKGARLGLVARMKRMISTPIPVLFHRIVMKAKDRINRKTYQRLLELKVKANEMFTATHIQTTPFEIDIHHIPEDLSDSYDFFLVGSDQVWNPNFRHGSPIDFIQFAPREKRIAFSPSFGISEIPEEYRDTYRQWLNEMAFLSVREHTGAGIIRSLTGREAEVLVDPTLMLTRGQWQQLARPARHKPPGDYLFTYFLGDVSRKRNRLIEQIARQHQLEIVRISSLKDIKRYVTDTAEFVDYIQSSSIVLTDSFHGAVFSLLFEKPFVVFNREGKSAVMSSRIDSLLSTFQLQSRTFDSLGNTGNYFDIDFSHVQPLLEKERIKARTYLLRALNLEAA